jgi:hypothetical protein
MSGQEDVSWGMPIYVSWNGYPTCNFLWEDGLEHLALLNLLFSSHLGYLTSLASSEAGRGRMSEVSKSGDDQTSRLEPWSLNEWEDVQIMSDTVQDERSDESTSTL